MQQVVLIPVRRLAGAMADLRDRVRTALTGEIARVVSDAVREVVTVILRGGPFPVYPTPRMPVPPLVRRREEERDPWDDRDWDPDEVDRDPRSTVSRESSSDESPDEPEETARTYLSPTAVAAGMSAGRWWLRRRGSLLEALGVGIVVAIVTLTGGPVARAGAIAVSAAADLTAATEALDAGAARLDQF